MKDMDECALRGWRSDWGEGFFHNLSPGEDGIYLDVMRANRGFVCLPALDGGESGASWGAALVEGFLPPDCGLRVYAFCSDSPQDVPWPDRDEGIRSLYRLSRRELWPFLRELYGQPVSDSRAFSVGDRGRFLWIMLELISGGGGDPVIRDIVFDRLCPEPRPAAGLPDENEPGLSSLDLIERDYDTRAEDIILGRDDRLYRCMTDWAERDKTGRSDADMYTVEGVRRSVERLTGTRPLIIESERVDPNSRYCPDSELYIQLYGDDPYRFFVLLKEDVFADREEIETFRQEMKKRIPATTAMELVLMQNGIRLDRHSYLEINSMVGGCRAAALDGHVALQFDTMIGGECNE